jgi:hypothetical protein
MAGTELRVNKFQRRQPWHTNGAHEVSVEPV